MTKKIEGNQFKNFKLIAAAIYQILINNRTTGISLTVKSKCSNQIKCKVKEI